MRVVAFLALLVVGCSSSVDPEPANQENAVVSSKPTTPPVKHPSTSEEKECTAVKVTPLDGCELYTLKCDDGSDDMVFLCPIPVFYGREYIPEPYKAEAP